MTDKDTADYPSTEEIDALQDKIDRGETISKDDISIIKLSLEVLAQRIVQVDHIRHSRQERVARGAYTGGPKPYGFTWNAAQQRWESGDFNENQALLEMKALRSLGKSYRGIAAELNQQGFPTPRGAKEWRASTVRRILLNNTVLDKVVDLHAGGSRTK